MKQQKLTGKDFAQYSEDLKWFYDNYESLLDSFSDKFVAVLEKSIIDSDTNIEQLRNKLLSKYSEKYPSIFIDYIYRNRPNFVL